MCTVNYPALGIPSCSGMIRTTGSDIGPSPSTLVANTVTVIDTPPLKIRQGEDWFIFFSVCAQICWVQADAGIVIESNILSEVESETEYVIV